MLETQQKQKVLVHVRWMLRRDAQQVMAVENQSFEFPWPESDFKHALRQWNCRGMVAEYDGHIIGFMIFEIHNSRIHLLNFAVDPQFRRCRVGSQMLATLLLLWNRSRITLEVRETNLIAQLFFKNFNQPERGFRAVSVLHGYYADTPEDAYLMQYGNPVFVTPEQLKLQALNQLQG
jgi:ribosomal-protein-alanine N-acetyltransferase